MSFKEFWEIILDRMATANFYTTALLTTKKPSVAAATAAKLLNPSSTIVKVKNITVKFSYYLTLLKAHKTLKNEYQKKEILKTNYPQQKGKMKIA